MILMRDCVTDYKERCNELKDVSNIGNVFGHAFIDQSIKTQNLKKKQHLK